MAETVFDCFYLNIEDAYRAAEAGHKLAGADGRRRPAYCYYDGPLTDITLPNFIQVSAERFVEFFSHNQLPIPTKIAISQDGDVQFNDTPADIVSEIYKYRATYKPNESIHFDTYFVDPLMALNVAKQRNRVACGHPTIDGLQACYYRGELPTHNLENLIHLELTEFEDFFIRSRLRMPENIQMPDALEAELQASVREDFAHATVAVMQRRAELINQLLSYARSLSGMSGIGKPKIFIPSNRLTTVMQYSSRGIAKAFADLGWEVLFYIQDNELEGSNVVDMLEKYIEFAPDACFCINSLNNGFMHPDVFNLIWWQDLMPQIKNQKLLPWRERDCNFSISPQFDRYLLNCGAKRVERLHFVIDDAVFHSRATRERVDGVVFIGSSYLPAVNLDNPKQRQALNALIEVMENGGTFNEKTVARVANAASLDYEFVFWKLLHYVVRDHTLHWLCAADAEMPIDIYGRYWGEDDRVSPYYRGELAHGEPVAEVYRSVRYALVCHPFEINSQRLAEVAACGCIPVVYDCRDVAEAPHWDDYCLFFKTADQLRNILCSRLQPAKSPEGLAAQFTYRAAAERLIELSDLHLLARAGYAEKPAPESVPLLPEQFGDTLHFVSSDEAARQTFPMQLQTNLASLARYRPYLHEALLAAWSQQPITIFVDQAIRGEYWRVSVVQAGEQVYRLDNIALLEHRRLIAENAQAMTRENTCCYALVGLGAGYELLAAFKATALPISEMVDFEVPIYLIESLPEVWLLNLLLHDLSALISARRLQIYHGDDNESKLAREFAKFEAALPDVLFDLIPQPSISAAGLYQLTLTAKENRAERHLANIQEVADYYAAITPEHWRQKFSPERVGELRVMGFISRFSSFLKYCMRDWLDGFKRLGSPIELCSETENYYLGNIEFLIDCVNIYKPDLILTIDHFRYEFPGLPENLPFINWIQDMLPNITANNNVMHVMDFNFVFSKQWLAMNGGAEYKDYPAEYLPIGFNDAYYYPDHKYQYNYDLLVISHLGEIWETYIPFSEDSPKDDILNHIERELVKSNQISFQDLSSLYCAVFRYLNCLDLSSLHKLRMDGQFDGFAELKEIMRRDGFNVDEKIFEALMVGSNSRFHAHYLFKAKTLPIAAILNSDLKIRIGIYGKNWSNIKLFQPFAKGVAENGGVINHLMATSKICFNGSPGSTFHMRSVEIMAAGAFMISRRIYKDSSPLTDYFDEDDIVFYENELDLIEKVRFFLDNDELRYKLANALHEKVKKMFSYKTIATIVMTAIVNRLNNKG